MLKLFEKDFCELGIPEETLSDFERNLDMMVGRVVNKLRDNSQLLSHQLDSLIDRTVQHGDFMLSILSVGDWDLLEQSLLWIYRLGDEHHHRRVHKDILRLWMDAIIACLKPSSAACILPIYEHLVSNHELIEKEAIQSYSLGATISDEQILEMRNLLLEGDFTRSLQFAQAIVDQKGLEHLYLQTIQPAMESIGDLWMTGEIGVAEEHLATALLGRLITLFYSKVLEHEPTVGKAIVTAAPNEFHEVGARMVADLLELGGWDVSYLGSNTPVIDVLRHAQQTTPDLIAISICMATNVYLAKRLIYTIRQEPKLAKTKILVGGQVFKFSKGLWKHLGADGWAENPQTAQALAKKWIGA